MTGLDVRWEAHPEVDEEQNTVMIVHFRPDKKPKSQAEWYHLLGNYCHTMEKLINCPLTKTETEEKRLIDGELLTLTELQVKLSGCPTKHILAKWAQAW